MCTNALRVAAAPMDQGLQCPLPTTPSPSASLNHPNEHPIYRTACSLKQLQLKGNNPNPKYPRPADTFPNDSPPPLQDDATIRLQEKTESEEESLQKLSLTLNLKDYERNADQVGRAFGIKLRDRARTCGC